jgi:hypothetical protein
MRHEWVWMVILGFLLVAGYGLIPEGEPDQEGSDSFSLSAEGKKAFYSLAKNLHEEVDRSSEYLIPPEDADTLILLGPAQYPDRVQWQTLYDWVSEGRSLVFAARYDDPIVEMGPFDVRIVSRFTPEPEPEAEEEEEEANEPILPLSQIETSLAAGELDWKAQGVIAAPLDPSEVLLTVDGSAHVIQRQIGDGVLVVASSDYIFDNLPLFQGDNAVLAYRIIEAAYPEGPVYFDESLNAAGPPKVVGLLFGRPLRPLTLQLILCAVLFAWKGSRRMGRPVIRRPKRQRSLTEHATALGNLHFKVGSSSRIVASYLEYFRNELRLHYRKAEEVTALAARAGVDRGSVAGLLDQAKQGARNPNLPPAKAAWLVRSMADLKKKTERLKGASHGA